MPELPDIEAYLHALRPRLTGRTLSRVLIASPFLLRSVEPPVEAVEGKAVTALRRIGKRIVLQLGGGTGSPLFAVIHLMIAGRLRWDEDPRARGPARITLAAFGFTEIGTLLLTEAGTKRRASLTLVAGEESLRTLNPGGIEPVEATTTAAAFASALRRENRTLKRALCDPRTISGIGNAYSDEVLLEAGLSPVMLTSRLSDAQCAGLLDATRRVLGRFTSLLCDRFQAKFPGPGDVTAFRPEFGAHGKFGKPCPRCGTAIQRIVHAENETNYCPRCQTGGKMLADRSLSRLLRDDWPKTIEEWEDDRAS